ncbi:counting factor associated protein [Planoprotostelium fungivorum]|uniref:Counting factor associated protein n=1 Tax=Planoprotostelium fungivorum TaxID=1890364 RepID=A0A2P6NTY8_9EUKA|nr:counting factor associated protein [Planoprotostelium fungivorum]
MHGRGGGLSIDSLESSQRSIHELSTQLYKNGAISDDVYIDLGDNAIELTQQIQTIEGLLSSRESISELRNQLTATRQQLFDELDARRQTAYVGDHFQQTIQQLISEANDCEDISDKVARLLEGLVEEHEREKASIRSEMERIRDEYERLQSIHISNMDTAHLSTEAKMAFADLLSTIDQVSHQNQEISHRANEDREKREREAEELRYLEAQREEQRREEERQEEITELKSNVRRLEDELHDALSHHTAELQELALAHETEKNEYRERYNEDLFNRKEYEIHELSIIISDLRNELNETNENLSRVERALEEESRSRREDMTTSLADRHHDDGDGGGDDDGMEVELLRMENNNLNERITNLVRHQEESEDRLMSDRQRHRDEMTRLEEEREKEKREEKEERRKEREEFETRCHQMSEEMEALKNEISLLKEEKKKRQEENNREREEEGNKYREELQEMNRSHQIIIEDVRREAREEVERSNRKAAEKSARDRETIHQEKEDRHTRTITDMQKRHEAELSQIERDSQVDVESAKRDHKDEIEEMRRIYREEMEEVKRIHQQKMEKAKREEAERMAEFETRFEERRQRERDVEEKGEEEKVNRLEERLERVIRDHAREIEIQNSNHAGEMKRLREEHSESEKKWKERLEEASSLTEVPTPRDYNDGNFPEMESLKQQLRKDNGESHGNKRNLSFVLPTEEDERKSDHVDRLMGELRRLKAEMEAAEEERKKRETIEQEKMKLEQTVVERNHSLVEKENKLKKFKNKFNTTRGKLEMELMDAKKNLQFEETAREFHQVVISEKNPNQEEKINRPPSLLTLFQEQNGSIPSTPRMGKTEEEEGVTWNEMQRMRVEDLERQIVEYMDRWARERQDLDIELEETKELMRAMRDQMRIRENEDAQIIEDLRQELSLTSKQIVVEEVTISRPEDENDKKMKEAYDEIHKLQLKFQEEIRAAHLQRDRQKKRAGNLLQSQEFEREKHAKEREEEREKSIREREELKRGLDVNLKQLEEEYKRREEEMKKKETELRKQMAEARADHESYVFSLIEEKDIIWRELENMRKESRKNSTETPKRHAMSLESSKSSIRSDRQEDTEEMKRLMDMVKLLKRDRKALKQHLMQKEEEIKAYKDEHKRMKTFYRDEISEIMQRNDIEISLVKERNRVEQNHLIQQIAQRETLLMDAQSMAGRLLRLSDICANLIFQKRFLLWKEKKKEGPMSPRYAAKGSPARRRFRAAGYLILSICRMRLLCRTHEKWKDDTKSTSQTVTNQEMMKVTLLLCTLVALSFAISAPKWPKQYYARTVFSIPYWNMSEPIDVWYDGVNNRQRIDYYAGMATYVWRFDQQTLYEVVPRVDVLNCFQQPLGGDGGLTTVLPDLSTWDYAGVEAIKGSNCHKYVQIVKNGNTTANYNFYVDAKTMEPVQIYLFGYDFIFGSHPDIYILDFIEYDAGLVSDQVFNAPGVCKKQDRLVVEEKPNGRGAIRARGRLGQLSVFSPVETDDEFELFTQAHGKLYHSEVEKRHRRSVYQRNKRYIESHNAQGGKTYKLKMNKFGDYTQTELKELIRPSLSTPRSQSQNRATHTHKVEKSQKIPQSIDWVEKGAVNPPKDQGICGSCWTFGTTGTLEGAYFIKTGQLLSLSEQQLVDCAWTEGNSACDGGEASGALQFVMDNGGIALEQTYRYIMLDHFCNTEDRSGITIKGYVNVSSGDEKALTAAISLGPVAIAIDASHPSFTFYSEGVYNEPLCKNGVDDLDHEVLAVGYGTDDEGNEFYLVKNSWSTYWGDGGYIKMSRNNGNQCGIATAATYPLVNGGCLSFGERRLHLSETKHNNDQQEIDTKRYGRGEEGLSQVQSFVGSDGSDGSNSDQLRPQPYEYFLILDFEAQCEENIRLKPQEIVEFPVLALNSLTLKVDHVFHTYVRPTVYPNITPFCTQLTGITQDMTDGGFELRRVLELFEDWLQHTGLSSKKWTFVTCGDWDLNTCLPSEARDKKMNLEPHMKRWLNIKKMADVFWGGHCRGMLDILKRIDLDLSGRHHSGIDDCTNICRGLQQMLSSGLDTTGQQRSRK